MNRIAATLACCCLLTGAALANTPPEVANVVATQRPHTALIDVTYDLIDADGDAILVSLWYSKDGGASWDQECLTVSGDVGNGVEPGTGLTATWDAGTDCPDYASFSFALRVYADDGSSLVPQGFVLIPPESVPVPVTYTMGDDEFNIPPQEVTLTRRFVMSSTEITNAQFAEALQWAYDNGYVTMTPTRVVDALDGSTAELLELDSVNCQITFDGSVFATVYPDRPVIESCWYGAAAYCDWQSLRDGLPRAYDHATWTCNAGDPYGATGYRLPTEAEWEFACRAGTTTFYNTGNCLADANFNGFQQPPCSLLFNLGRTTEVGSYAANAWGLHDMHGNVWELCNDWYASTAEAGTDPTGPGTGSSRSMRGGGYISTARGCASAVRISASPGNFSYHTGFRPVRTAD